MWLEFAQAHVGFAYDFAMGDLWVWRGGFLRKSWKE
jgi:hypothetical protein